MGIVLRYVSRVTRKRYVGILLALVLMLPVSASAGWRTARAQGGSTDTAIRAAAGAFNPTIDRSADHVAGEVLVKLREPSALSSRVVLDVMSHFGLRLSDEVVPGWYKLSAADPGSLDVEVAAKALESTGAVERAQPNHLYYADVAPNDEEYTAGQQWSVTQVHAEQAWDITTGSPNIVIALVDTGAAADHPDLSGKVLPGYDFYNNDSDPSDDLGHGTMTAGIAAAQSNNGTGITGISWGAQIMPVKVLGGQNGSGSDEMLARGIRWAVDHGANIINASLGGGDTSPVQDDALKYAHDHNVLVVAAAGNTPDGKPHYPAASASVLAVAATGRSDTVTGFSSYGPYVGVAAPGVGILSTSTSGGHNGYEYGNGTSFSCPIVSGVAALVWSVNPQLTADEVKYILEDSADDVGPAGFDDYSGFGRVNAARAVQMAQQGRPPTRTPTPPAKPSNTPAPTATSAPVQGPNLQLDSRQPSPGSLLAITGGGYAPNEIVDLSVQANGNTRELGTAQSNQQGGFRAEVALPKDLALGNYSLVGVGITSKLTAKVDITVVAGTGNSGQSVIKGTIRGANGGSVTAHLNPSVGVAGPEQTAQADAGGAYSFTNLASGIYALSVTASGALPAGPFTVQVDGTATDVKTIDITIATQRPQAFDRVPQLFNTPTLLWFPEVGHSLKGPFLKFWQQHGGLAIFGYPISEEFPETSATDGKTYTVQYFERNRFEYHPEFASSGNDVLMGLLGIQVTQGRTFLPGAPFQSTPTQAYFPQTQHSLSGPFLKYWQSHGGLAIFGYPISEELMENGFLVQYFERNRFEYHSEFANTPNDVLLGLLGDEVAKRNGWIAP
jgi:subtilisin family serine protease